MTRASTSTEKASPKPNSASSRPPPNRKEPKTRIMMPAAAAMIRPLLAWPDRTARWLRAAGAALLPALWCHSSCMRLTR
jgi:hypothetical protein